MTSCKTLKGGLQEVADDLGVRSFFSRFFSEQLANLPRYFVQVSRIGPQHQAGSDSLLTAATFFKMRDKFFENKIEPKFMVRARTQRMSRSQADRSIVQGVLYGLNSSSTPANPAYPREYNGAVHYPINVGTPTPSAAPLAAAASSAIAIMSPSPKQRPAAT